MSSFEKAPLEKLNLSASKCKYPAGLYLVATPIGNLEDITLRALYTLEKADAIVCEDTRVTKNLLSHYGIHKPLMIYNDMKGAETRQGILELLQAGKRLALVSDAGMPLIADPGYKLVQEVIERGIYVTCIPGPSAGLTALLVSGIPSDAFSFCGFFPRKDQEARAVLEALPSAQTFIFYESPNRLEKTLNLLAGNPSIQKVAVARELTKAFEQIIRGTPQEVVAQLPSFPLKGEMVLIVQTEERTLAQGDIDVYLKQALMTQSVKSAVEEVCSATGVSKKALYQRALVLKEELSHGQ